MPDDFDVAVSGFFGTKLLDGTGLRSDTMVDCVIEVNLLAVCSSDLDGGFESIILELGTAFKTEEASRDARIGALPLCGLLGVLFECPNFGFLLALSMTTNMSHWRNCTAHTQQIYLWSPAYENRDSESFYILGIKGTVLSGTVPMTETL
ncbi:hypothetical protein NQZ79_g6417 [Umbelopsis isabellina]|nr:hypothetical protein NQZ79_g6417 [Umbelopsis isabellina]